MRLTRLGALVASETRNLYRNPLTAGLMVLLPAYFINVMAHLMPAETVTVAIGGEQVTTGLDQLLMLRVGPITVAIVAGITGLFLIQQSRDVDERAFVTGYTQVEAVLARIILLSGVVVGTSAVAFTVLQFHATPDNLGAYVAGMVLGGTVYGLIGFVAGLVLREIGGVYIMLLGPGLDLMMFQNPLMDYPDDVIQLLPGHYPMQLVEHAAWGITVGTDLYMNAAAVFVATGVAGIFAFLVAHRT